MPRRSDDRAASRWVGAVVALGVGLSGAVAAIRGWGLVTISSDVQPPGLLAITAAGVLLIVVLTVIAHRLPVVTLVASAVAAVATAMVTAANVGRAPSVVAMLSVLVSYAVFVEWRPWAGHPRRRHRVAWFAVPFLVAAQFEWVLRDSQPVTVILLGLAMVAVELAAWRPDETEALQSGVAAVVRRTAASMVRWAQAIGAAATATAGAARRGASRVVAAGGGLSERVVRRARSFRRRLASSRWARAVVRWADALGVDGDGRGLLWASLGAGLVASPIFWRLVNDDPSATYLGINDYDIHVTSARFITFLPFRMDVPHFAFHLSTALLQRLVGARVAPVVVLSVAAAATFAAIGLLFRTADGWGRRVTPRAARVTTVVWACMETPTVVLLYLGLVSPRTRFMTMHVLYSPTWVTAFPLSLLTLLTAGWLLREVRDETARQISAASATSIALLVTSTAKPALAVCLLPGLSVYLLARRVPFGRIVALMARVSAPTVLLVAWQTWYLTTGQSANWSDDFTFRPIGGPVYGWSQARWAFWFPIVWIALAVWATRGRFLRDALVQLTLCCAAFALAIFLLFVETGDRAGHGNLGVPLQLCAAFLILLALRALAVEAAGVIATWRDTDVPLWFGVSGLFAVAFVAGGLIAYADTLGWTHVPISWYPLY